MAVSSLPPDLREPPRGRRGLGHKGVTRIEDTYGHLQDNPSRLPEVRYPEADAIDLDACRSA